MVIPAFNARGISGATEAKIGRIMLQQAIDEGQIKPKEFGQGFTRGSTAKKVLEALGNSKKPMLVEDLTRRIGFGIEAVRACLNCLRKQGAADCYVVCSKSGKKAWFKVEAA